MTGSYLSYRFCALAGGPKNSGKLCTTMNRTWSSYSFPNRWVNLIGPVDIQTYLGGTPGELSLSMGVLPDASG